MLAGAPSALTGSLPQEALPCPALRSQPQVHFLAVADHSHTQRSLGEMKKKRKMSSLTSIIRYLMAVAASLAIPQ